jgi:hypothetical protein
MDLMEIMKSPLTQAGPGSFLRLVLAEAASYGMPPQVVATLDDVAAMLGLYDPLPTGQAAHLAGPIVQWRTDRRQPTHERVVELERLALKQRALIAFGGAPTGHQVGTAEIVAAMGNLHKEWAPGEYYDVFTWASVDVLGTLMGSTPDELRKEKGWSSVSDADVIQPGGRLYPTYVEMATEIRRFAIASLKGDSEGNPREYLRPLGVYFLKAHLQVQARAEKDGRADVAKQLNEIIATIRTMFPNIDQAVDWISQPAKTG